ncbi:MAG: alpha/beta fold hydrolase [Luteitalea sp.]|nr:alpha/beta fold hydrolase [Luteitalea sp.]
MMKAIRLLLVTIYVGLSISTVQGQVHQNPTNTGTNTNDRQEQLPRLEDWFLSTGDWHDNPQLYVREFGDGSETIVMLHGGWGAEHSGLINAVKDLKNRYRFVFYDQRGSLRSPSPDSLITFDRHIEDLEPLRTRNLTHCVKFQGSQVSVGERGPGRGPLELLRQELNVDKLTIIGHSMGAVLASAYASKYPQRIEQLILLSPAYLKNPIPEEDKDLQHQGYVSSQMFMNRPEVVQELDKYLLNRRDPPLSSREKTSKCRIDFASRMLYDIGKWRRLTGGRALYKGHVGELTSRTYPESGWDYLQEFKSRAYPVGIITGDHDFLDFGNPLMKKWVTGISQIELSIVEGAGHLIWLDQPEIVAKELLRHLERRQADAERAQPDLDNPSYPIVRRRRSNNREGQHSCKDAACYRP